MTLRHLKIFVAVAETKSMSAAARRCFITQPTVSQTIHELEEHYHTILFERLSRKLYITEAGKNLLSHARQVIDQFEQLEQSMADDSITQRLRIGATLTVGVCLLPHILNDFQEEMPAVSTYSYISNTEDIEQKILDSSLDIGIVEGNIKSPDLVSLPIIEDFLVLVCGRNHPFSQREQIPVQELEGKNFAMREAGSGTRALFEHYLHRHNLQVNIAWEASSPLAIKNAVDYNGGLSVMSIRLFQEEILNGDIHVVCNPYNEWERTFKLVYHKNKFMTSSIEQIRDILKRYRRPDILDYVKAGTLVNTVEPPILPR